MKGETVSANPDDESTATASKASGEERSESRESKASRAFYIDSATEYTDVDLLDSHLHNSRQTHPNTNRR